MEAFKQSAVSEPLNRTTLIAQGYIGIMQKQMDKRTEYAMDTTTYG